MSYFGIDVSEHNGKIDWAKVASKVDFAILRIGWVGNKNNHTLDKRFRENYEAAKKNGVKLGAYVYIYSNSEEHAKQGAEWALNQIKGLTFDLPIYCDMEDASIKGLGKAKLTNIVKAFNTPIENAGYWAGVYANLDWYKNYLNADIEKRYTSWIAHYTSGTDKYKGVYDMWQNSSKGKVDGINGNIDTDYLYRDLFSKISGKPTASKPTTPHTHSNGAEKFNSNYKYGKRYEVTANGGLRLRKGAGTGASIITVLPKGSTVTWYGYYTVVNGVTWKYVKVNSSGKVGYVSSEYLR